MSSVSVDLYAELIIQQSGTADLFSKFTVQGYEIQRTTYDKNGAILGDVLVKMFRSSDDIYFGQTTSNAVTGIYTVTGLENTEYYAIYLKLGSPDVWGTTDDIAPTPT